MVSGAAPPGGIDPELASQVAALLATADLGSVPSGILVWFGSTTMLPDGTAPTPPPVAQDAWTGVLMRLVSGAVRGATPLPALVAVGGGQPGQAVPLAIVSAAYHRPTSAAVDAVTAAGAQGGPAALPAALAESIEPSETTLATLLLASQFLQNVPVHRGRTIDITLDPNLLVTNLGAPITDVAVEIDGTWQPLASGASVTLTVPPGVAAVDVLVRCRNANGVRYATCHLGISDQPVCAPPDETWQLQPPGGNPGHAFVFRAGAGDRLQRPVLIAEGFPGRHSWQELTDCLDQHGFMTELRVRGHDVVVIGFDQGTESIQSNAGVVRAAVERAASATDDPLVVGGMSMGGLVSRYALLEMERDGADHRTGAYLSIDAPHGRGAYTTVQGQWLVNHFTGLSAAYEGLRTQIDAPANLQFVAFIERDGNVAPDPLRVELLDELRRLGGYPSRPVKLAVSCGSAGGGHPPATAPLLQWQVAGLSDISWLPTLVGDGTTAIASGATIGVPGATAPPLHMTSAVCWETVPGAVNVLNGLVTSVIGSFGSAFTSSLAASSSLPTVSALDVDDLIGPNDPIPPPGTGHSPFDDYTSADTDQFHLQFTADMVTWMLDRIERHQPAAAPTKGPPMSNPTTSSGATSASRSIDPSTFNPYDPAFIADPYPTYAWFREHAPVVPLSLVPTDPRVPRSIWVFDYADVNRVLSDTELFLKHASGPGAPPAGPPPPVFDALGVLPPGLLSSDPPRHDIVRGQVQPAFMTALDGAQELAEQVADELVAGFGRTTRIELVQDFALPLPQRVLAHVLGFPPEDMQAVLPSWAQAVATAHDITQPPSIQAFGGTCAMAMRTYIDALILENQAGRGFGMMDGVCRKLGPALGGRDVQSVMSDMLVAGYLTTTYLICSGMLALLTNPAQLAKLRADPSLIDSAVQEMLRYEAPAQFLDRQVAADTTLGGVALQQGTRLVLGIGSANRDSTQFPNGDAFDIARDNTGQMGFGWGIHHCIGAPLASQVAPVAIQKLLTLPNLRVHGLESWQPDPYLRGLTSLPMAFDG